MIKRKLKYYERYTSQVYDPLENDFNRAIMKMCLPEHSQLKKEMLAILDKLGEPK